MNNKSNSFWKKPRKGPRLLLLWLTLVITALVIFSIGILISGKPFTKSLDFGVVLIIGVVVASLLFALWLFVRWLCHWRNFKRFLFGLACFITLIALFYAEEDWRGKHDWEKFKHQWEAKGEKFSYASLIPPPVPDDQNFAMAPIWMWLIESDVGTNIARKLYGEKLIEQEPSRLANSLQMAVGDLENYGDWPSSGNWRTATLTDLKPWQHYYRALAAKTNLFPVAPRPQTPAKDVLLALSQYDFTINELRQASRRAGSRFPIYSHPDRPFDTLLPHLMVLKRCVQVLQLRAIAELQNGQRAGALADVKLALYLVNSIRTEPILISHLVRIAMIQITLQPIYEGLAEHKWSDAQLAGLDSELAKLNFLADYELAIRGERACGLGAINYLRQTRDLKIFEMPEAPGSNHQQIQNFFLRLVPSGWFYLNDLALARMDQHELLPLVNVRQRIVSPAAAKRAGSAEASFAKNGSFITSLARLVYPALSQAVEKFACAQESVDLARVAIALERYRLAHGKYPESLDALTPRFLAKLPHDIINGRPLHYRRTSDGQFILYSVGWNEKDDGGVVVLYKGSSDRVDISKGDWVWRYPSKAE